MPIFSTVLAPSFLIYINDMPDAVKCKLLLYADDSAILASRKDTVYVEETLSKELHFFIRMVV